jgi:hypothetical protein
MAQDTVRLGLDTSGFADGLQLLLRASSDAFEGIQRQLQQLQQSFDALGKTGSQLFAPINRAFEASVSGLLLGTRNWQQAMQSVLRATVSSFVGAIDRMVVAWLTGELDKTAATQTGAAARSAAESQSQASGLGEMAANAVKYILNSGAQTFAGVFAFLSDLLGPGAVAPAAAAEASVIAVAGDVVSAAGGYAVPADSLAFLHKDEVVLPKTLADGFRGIIAGQGGAGKSDTHLHVHAMDSADVARFFKRHGRALAKVVNGELKDNISLRPGF